MKTGRKLCAVCLAVCLLLVVLTGCAGKKTGEYTVDTVTVTYVKSPLNVPSIVEKAQGDLAAAYKEMGLGFAYSELTSGADQTAALASGSIQILNAVGGTSVILAAANGADIKIISMYSTSPGAFQLFSADPEINSPEDLKGKTIAGPKGTNLHELLVAYLAQGGLTLDDVEYVSMDIPSAFAALEGGSVDCALQAGSNAYDCAAAGYHMVTDGQGLITGTILTATTQEFYDENPEIIETFLQVQQEVLTFMDEHHDEALEMAAEETGLDLAAVEEMYGLYDFRMDLTEEDLDGLQNTAQFMLDNGLIEQAVDVSTLVLER